MAKSTIEDIERIAASRIKKVTARVKGQDVWIYTRVSSKAQTEGYSIDVQDEVTKKFAKELGFIITNSFGGSYESASSDVSRKEFNKLLSEIKKARRKPFAIIVYDASRFSRTGSGGISIMQKLKNEHGVYLYSACDGTNNYDSDRGEITLGKQLLSAQEDNLNRKDKISASLIKFTHSGKWLGVAPLGYTHYGHRVKDPDKISAQQKIIINSDGKKLKMAWQWKLRGMKDVDIRKQLALKGLTVSKQYLSRIWRNYFYCGLIISRRTGSKAIKGHWEAMVSYSDFMRVQKLIEKNNVGYVQAKISEDRPLQDTLFCSECNRKFTGYPAHVGKKKQIIVHYYKCQICKSASFNADTTPKSTHKGLHDTFYELLATFALKPVLKPLISKQLVNIYEGIHAEQAEEKATLNRKAKELDSAIETIETKDALNQIQKHVFERLYHQFVTEQRDIQSKLQTLDYEISNLNLYLKKALLVAEKPHEIWGFGNLVAKQDLQKLFFPNGLVVDVKSRQYLTKNMNPLFYAIQGLSRDFDDKKKGLLTNNDQKSYDVARPVELSNLFVDDLLAIIDAQRYCQYQKNLDLEEVEA